MNGLTPLGRYSLAAFEEKSQKSRVDFRYWMIAFGVICFGIGSLLGDVVPAPLFSDHAVLQRDKPVPVWGTAEPDEEVLVTFRGQEHLTKADAEGRWQIVLDPMEASAEGDELRIRGKNDVRLQDVVVGEVWLASGQSNMAWRLQRSRDGDIESAGADWPQIRRLDMARKVAEAPMETNETTGWQVTTPESAGGFSAVAYYFARDIHRIMGVPVGIIVSAVGGTPIEAWMEPSSSEPGAGPEFAALHERWAGYLSKHSPQADKDYEARLEEWRVKREEARKAGMEFSRSQPSMPRGPNHPGRPSGLFNGMIAPAVPYALRGVIWYQGESNVRSAAEYPEFFRTLIDGWREAFGQKELPFYWVQLANFKGRPETNWAWLREAQSSSLDLPATGQAIAIDVGDVTDIHPSDKLPVGRRLARLALNRTYGKQMPDAGPAVVSWENKDGGVLLHFTPEDGGLKYPSGRVTGFEVAGGDRVFHPADAAVQGGSVLVSSALVKEPLAVRYAWQSAPEASLFNATGLPAAPFRTDDWPVNREEGNEAH